MLDYRDRILSVIGQNECVSSEQIAERLGVTRNCILQDLYQLHVEHKIDRTKVVRRRGGVSYLYTLPFPWSEWPSWTLMTDLPVCRITCTR